MVVITEPTRIRKILRLIRQWAIQFHNLSYEAYKSAEARLIAVFVLLAKQFRRVAWGRWLVRQPSLIFVLILIIIVNANNVMARLEESKAGTKDKIEPTINSSLLFRGFLGNGLSQVFADKDDPWFTEEQQPGLNSLNGTTLTKELTTEEAEAEMLDLELSGGNFALAGFEQSFFGPGIPTTLNPQREEIIYYEVKNGDTIGSISVDFEVTVDTILWANNLTYNDYIQPGDKLIILPTSGVMHKVKSGETMESIAKKYQADAEEIAFYNKASSGQLQAGQTLIVPGGIKRQVVTKVVPKGRPITKPRTAPGISGSGWLWPTATRTLNSGFGYRRWGRYVEMHTGIDIGGGYGQAIVASKAGVVSFAGWRSGYGKTIILKHPDGTQTLYAHMSGYVRTKGSVARGETIGRMGSTGRSTGVHLHFEIRVNGRPVNPLNYVR